MLYRELLQTELERQRDTFQAFSDAQHRECEDALALLARLTSKKFEELENVFSGKQGTGALPSKELNGDGNISEEFGKRWSNHEEARAWASGVLSGRTTYAADGSQLFPGKEVPFPVAAIQVGWFENPHDAGERYVKDAEFRLLGPDELLGGDEPADPETRVGEERFLAEVSRVREFLDRKKGWSGRGERMPLAFFDGTLLVSFSLPKTKLQKVFVDAMKGLVETSEACRVPVVGYVDRSLSRDLLALLDAFDDREASKDRVLVDSSFLGVCGLLANWGDRTRFLYSNRMGMEEFSGRTGSGVGFIYFATARGSLPSRLDVPAWVFEDGLLDEVADIVRAECVVGVGYPYPLEAADATALITSKDRRVFLKALQDFALREKLDFSVSRKGISKGRRR